MVSRRKGSPPMPDVEPEEEPQEEDGTDPVESDENQDDSDPTERESTVELGGDVAPPPAAASSMGPPPLGEMPAGYGAPMGMGFNHMPMPPAGVPAYNPPPMEGFQQEAEDPVVNGEPPSDKGEIPRPQKIAAGEIQATRDAWAEFADDQIVDVRVMRLREDLRAEPRGMMNSIPMTLARLPEKWIDKGGTFYLDIYNPASGRKIGHTKVVELPGAAPDPEWRVGVSIERAVMEALQKAGISVGGGIPALGQAGPIQAVLDKMSALESRIARDEEDRRRKDELRQAVEPLQEHIRRLETMMQNGAGQKKESLLETITALVPLFKSDDSAAKVQLEIYKAQNSPEASYAKQAIENAQIENLLKLGKATSGGGDGKFDAGKAMELGKSFLEDRKQQRAADIRALELKVAAEEKAREESRNAALEAAKAKDRANEPTALINGMLGKIVESVRARRPPVSVANLIYMMARTVNEFEWTNIDPSMTEMISQLSTVPGATIIQFGMASGIKAPPSGEEAAYLTAVEVEFRKLAGMPEWKAQGPVAELPAAPAAPVEPVVCAPAAEPAAPEAPAAPEPPAAEPPPPAAEPEQVPQEPQPAPKRPSKRV